MKNVQKSKRANKSLPFFFRDEFKVSFVIIFASLILLVTTFTFDVVPPILNRGIQPATFPKALLILIIAMTSIIYYLAIKNPWKIKKKLPRSFFLTLFSFVLFVIVSKTLDFFLAISTLSIFVSYYWGEKRLYYLLLVGIIFPIIVFVFFETILGLRFPPGIITNIYYS
ncbi:tripartite tricarboxylate transporter TctB family protein [Candidatus Pelagibacter sp.]|nr:tripartite tricarboxylate transporter TctB family protein [Candidatus Pelagibacter sp.]